MPHEPDSSSITWSDYEFPGSISRTITTKQIINKETGHVVVTFRDNSNEIQKSKMSIMYQQMNIL